jgi:hypothetical protein
MRPLRTFVFILLLVVTGTALGSAQQRDTLPRHGLPRRSLRKIAQTALSSNTIRHLARPLSTGCVRESVAPKADRRKNCPFPTGEHALLS